VNDARVVRRLERLGDLSRDWQRFIEWQRALRETFGEVLALDEFHDERAMTMPGVGRAILEAIDLRDVRVVQRGQGLRFALEAHQPIRIEGKGIREDLQCDVAPELGIARPIDLAHSAFAQFGHHLIWAEALANHACGLSWASARPRRSSPNGRAETGPPAPRGETISEGPRRVPGDRAIGGRHHTRSLV
jgi:hypothetical protein